MRIQLLAISGLLFLSISVAACTGGSGGDPTPTPTPTATPTGTPVVTVAVVGTDGAQVTTDSGVVVDIPAGALDEAETITITESTDAPPSTNTPYSALYVFEPHGIVFAQPVTVTLPLSLPQGTTTATVFWEKHDQTGYEDVGGTIEGATISAQVVHFSDAFVAAPTGERTVSGSKVITWHTGESFTNVPVDLSTLQVVALVVATNGSLTTYTGTGNADGTFEIQSVPYGSYYLQIGTQYVVTSESVVDLGYTDLGRAMRDPASSATSITMNVTNLAPWQNGDQLELISAGAASYYFFIEQSVPVTAGATELSGYTFDASVGEPAGPVSLIDGGAGDRAVFAQLSQRLSDENVPYQSMSRVFSPAPFTQVDGGNTVLTGAFTDVSIANTVSIDLRSSQFEALVPSIHPNATTSFRFFGVLGQPGGLERGAFSGSADFLLLFPGATDVVATNMGYGLPLVGTWGAYGSVGYYNDVPVQIGAATPRNVRANMFTNDSIAGLAAAPIVPRISPVLNPTVGGADLTQPQTGVGTAPLLAWNAPSTGTADVYTVRISRVFDDGGATALQRIASFRTTGTSLRIPAGVLVNGESYQVQIFAESTAVSATAPYRQALPHSLAPKVSALFSP